MNVGTLRMIVLNWMMTPWVVSFPDVDHQMALIRDMVGRVT